MQNKIKMPLIQIIIFITSFYSMKLNKTKEIPKNISSNIVDDIKKLLFILPEDKIISFNNSLINVTLYNTSDISFSYDKMNINFENCLTILQKVYNLDPFFDYSNQNSNEIYKRCFFIIIKIEIDRKLAKDNNTLSFNNDTNTTSLEISLDDNTNTLSLVKNNSIIKRPTNHIEYLIFNGKNGKLLNTSYCNDLNVRIQHPIVEQNIIDLNSSKKFYEEYNIDVFRTNDSFFNDICMNFTSEKNKDMTLTLKRQYFFQNVSFCDENCTYIEINYTSNTAVCACEVTEKMNDDLLLANNNDNDKSFTYEDVISVINYKIFKCYKQVFDIKRLAVNAGNYFSLSLLLLYTLCVINFYKNRKKNVMEYYQKIKTKLEQEDTKKKNKKNNEDNKSSNSSDIGSDKNIINRNESHNNSNYDKDNGSEKSNNSEEDQKEESNNKSINEINIIDISFKDIAPNPPVKKNKIKLKINQDDTDNQENEKKNRMKNIKYFLNVNNSATKDTYNYGEIKLDTADELIDTKNNNENVDQNFNEIITIKKKGKNKPKISTTSNSILSSTKHNTIKSKTKKSNDSSNANKTNTSNNNDEKTNNNNYNNYNYIFPSNYSVEIPISNIVPSFLKSKNNLLNSNNINFQNWNINPTNSRKINAINTPKDLRSSQNSQKTFIFKRTKTKTNNAIHNNFISKHDNDFISNKEDKNDIKNITKNIANNKKGMQNIHKSTLRRTKEIEAPKRSKTKKKERKGGRKNFFGEFDDMKFEIAILIDNRNFCEKFICELKEKCIIILLLFRKDVIFKQIELSLFILSFTLDYFFNAFLYSDIYLDEEFKEDNIYRILINYPKEILASLIAQFILKLTELLMEEKAFSLFLKRVALSDRNYLKAINYLLKKHEKRFVLFIIIGYFFLIITWYLASAFSTVYQNSQLNLLFDTLESLALNIFLPLPLSFLSIVFRHLAILKLNKFLFFISNIIRIFV